MSCCRAGLILLVFSAWILEEARAAEEPRPNVVLVMTDDQGYGDLSCHGNPVLKTPTLDRLHAESIRLTDFHVDPTCAPTRSALLTGRYSCRTGVWHTIMGRSLLRRDETTMAELFAAAGYRTGIFGKWHLGDNAPYRPGDRGFQESLIHRGGGIGQSPDYWGNTYFAPTLLHNGKPVKTEGYCTDVFFDAAFRFVEANRERPFLLYLPPNAPHRPWQVDDKYSRPFREAGVRRDLADFYGMLVNFDENMDRLLEALRRLGLEENTIFIFLTDNGSSSQHGFNAGMRAYKGSWYEGGHRVPCFIRWPKRLQGGRDVEQLAAHVDVLPTLLDLCGIEKPENPRFDGASLRPLLEGKTDAWPERTIFVQSHRIEHPKPWRQSAVMTEQYRLIEGKELYDIQQDPSQKRDIAKDKPEVVASLRQAYQRWYKDVSRRFDEYCRIMIGSPQENPATLCCHDWHGPRAPWDQSTVRKRMVANGFWALEVARAGRYAFTLRERPEVAAHPLPKGTVRIKIVGQTKSAPIPTGTTGVRFEIPLKAGPAKLQTWIAESGGKERGAYYVDVEYLAPRREKSSSSNLSVGERSN